MLRTLIAAFSFLIVQSAGAFAAGLAATPFPFCSWWTETTATTVNVAFPDSNAAYWTTRRGNTKSLFRPAAARTTNFTQAGTSLKAPGVMYVFTQQATMGRAPVEVIMPEARWMPLYRLINDPFRAFQERADVKQAVDMADLLQPREAAAQMRRGDTVQRSRNFSEQTPVFFLTFMTIMVH
jgi:hypothetical protein